jgi:alpha-amylase/alpha-mannosidase (GH57 family)
MPKIYICFLWHMHQPFYKDLATGEYKLPWTRMHALKDYRGMVRILEEFPSIHQTFNIVPSMMSQVEDYASGQASDPFLKAALKPAEELTAAEQAFVLQYFFQANPSRMIHRHPRYGELYEAWVAADRKVERARMIFNTQAFRDLQVLSQLAWFDEDALAGDAAIAELVRKGRDYSLQDQADLGHKQTQFLATVIPAYQQAAGRGQIEISTTPFYHPILPLLCDSNIAAVAHPSITLPNRYRYPEDARLQLERSREFIHSRFGSYPSGLWPSEGSVSDEALRLAADLGFRWAATDDGVLARTLGRSTTPGDNYRPYLWRHEGREMRVLFRDHFLSDLVGFVYSRMDAAKAAADFIHRIHENCRSSLAQHRDALVPIILDGENAWEYYDRNGRPFLRELYRRVSEDNAMAALTVSMALEHVEPEPIKSIFPGSWINANFDIWIGGDEDNQAWEHLLRARQTYDRMAQSPEHQQIPEQNRSQALEELLIAEGSDWCWWYGPEHASENRPEFDRLFRDHLSNVYRALALPPPDELSRPILRTGETLRHRLPVGLVHPTIDGEVTSFFEWLGAGLVKIDGRSGAMHGGSALLNALYYGCDVDCLYLRLVFEKAASASLPGMQVRVIAGSASVWVDLEQGHAEVVRGTGEGVRAAFRESLEMAIPLENLRLDSPDLVRLQISLWSEGLPVECLPSQGWLECPTAEPSEW